MVDIGIFGKIPSYAEFISVGASSATGQSFGRWVQMANDQVARAGCGLPMGPLGFCYRDESATSLLVGVVVGSRDKVGRKFPLAVFCEFDAKPPASAARLVEALRPVLTQLSVLGLTAGEVDPESLKRAAQRITLPPDTELRDALPTSLDGLESVSLQQVLERLYPEGESIAYGINVLTRACEQTLRDGARRPTTLDVTVTSDVELAFWLAGVESRLGPNHGPVSAFWDVPSQRALVIPGVPDSNTLVFLASAATQNAKLWRASTSSETANEAAWGKLEPAVREQLEQPGACTVAKFVRTLGQPPP